MVKKNFAFYLLGEKGYLTIKAVVKYFNSLIIEYIVIGKDKNIKNDYSNEILEFCELHNIKYYFKHDNIADQACFTLAIGWRWIINKDDLIVLHDSILPKYRGFAPLVNSLINKEKFIGVTALWATNEYDSGNVIYQSQIQIQYPIKIQKAIELISECYINCAVKVISILQKNNSFNGYTQNEELASYSMWRDELDYYINWNTSSEDIKRFIDSVGYPYEGAKTNIGNKCYTIIDAEKYTPDVNIESRVCHIGKVIFIRDEFPIVICKEGLLKILDLRDEGNQNILPLERFRIRFTS